MKSENRIYLKGKLGSDAHINKVGERSVANFSLATDYDYKKSDGSWDKETTWHNITAWQGFGVCELSLLVKGVQVCVAGRVRKRTYTDKQGTQKDVTEVVADTVDILASEKPAQSRGFARSQGNYGADEDDF